MNLWGISRKLRSISFIWCIIVLCVTSSLVCSQMAYENSDVCISSRIIDASPVYFVLYAPTHLKRETSLVAVATQELLS